MTGHGAKFGRKKEEAIVALLTHRNVEDAARAVGVGATTLLRWLKLPEFQKAFRQARRLAYGQGLARLQQASGAAVTTLLKLLMDTNVPPAVRARASYYILTLSRQWMETDDIDARVAELEEAADRAQRER
jgi:hypothetical protein